jgi:DNA polymerase
MSMARPEHGLTTGLSLAKLAAHYELGVKGTEVVAALGMRRGDFSHQQLYEYGQYCCNDVDLTYDAFRRLAVRFPRQELEIIDMMIRMFTEPVLTLDGDVLQSHLDAVIANKERLMATIEVGTADIMSNDKFAAALESYGVVPPTKISPKTGKLAYAFAKTDSDFKDLLEHEDERVQALVAARLGLKSTLEETRTQAFLGIKERGTLPIMLNYYGAHTGRACLTGDTEITVLRGGCATSILLETLEPDDLVWDGEAFVAHGGLVDQGFKEIMDYQGVTGTFDHRVYVDEINEAVELREASQRGYTLCAMEPPAGYAYDVANTSGSCEE